MPSAAACCRWHHAHELLMQDAKDACAALGRVLKHCSGVQAMPGD